jgi:hypothetical protein
LSLLIFSSGCTGTPSRSEYVPARRKRWVTRTFCSSSPPSSFTASGEIPSGAPDGRPSSSSSCSSTRTRRLPKPRARTVNSNTAVSRARTTSFARRLATWMFMGERGSPTPTANTGTFSDAARRPACSAVRVPPFCCPSEITTMPATGSSRRRNVSSARATAWPRRVDGWSGANSPRRSRTTSSGGRASAPGSSSPSSMLTTGVSCEPKLNTCNWKVPIWSFSHLPCGFARTRRASSRRCIADSSAASPPNAFASAWASAGS